MSVINLKNAVVKLTYGDYNDKYSLSGKCGFLLGSTDWWSITTVIIAGWVGCGV